MEHNLEQLKKRFQKITLTSGEKAGIQTRLVSFMHDRPLPRRRSFSSFFSFPAAVSHFSFKLAPVIMIALLFAGGGISRVAENALPGDILYPVKTSFNEEVKGLLLGSEERAAEFELDLAAKRLDELEMASLKEEGVSEEVVAEIDQKFEKHIERAEEKIRALELREIDDPAVKKVRQRLEEVNDRKAGRKFFRSGQGGRRVMVPERGVISAPADLELRSAREADRESQAAELSNESSTGRGDKGETRDNSKTRKASNAKPGGAPPRVAPPAPLTQEVSAGAASTTQNLQDRLQVLEERLARPERNFSRDFIERLEKQLQSLEGRIGEIKNDPARRSALPDLEQELNNLERVFKDL